ncbi:MAG: ABC transporter substrate-binding protein [Spirochaetes bacterium]|nr:ABC transporter substrate-binding protein [Spirochaetota bacterium]
MKRIPIAFATGAIVLAFSIFAAGCAKPAPVVIVGVAKFVSHPALDALEKGVIESIKAAKPGIALDLQNSNADMGTAAQIARRFADEKVAVAVGIATPTAQALANAIKTIPVVYCAVTDPVAAGLVASLDKGGPNITGSSDMTPLNEQLDLLIRLKPIKRLGHVYNAGEANSSRIAELVKEYCAVKGIEFVGATVANSSEVKQAALSIADRVDGIYLSTDNTVFSAIDAVAEVALERKLPVITADPSSAETVPVLGALGYDYYAMGLATGKIVVKILDGAKTTDIPAYIPSDPKEMLLVLNLDVAAKIGIAIPKELADRAAILVENGAIRRK